MRSYCIRKLRKSREVCLEHLLIKNQIATNPDPDPPTIATFLPGSISKLRLRKISLPGPYEKLTFSNLMDDTFESA